MLYTIVETKLHSERAQLIPKCKKSFKKTLLFFLVCATIFGASLFLIIFLKDTVSETIAHVLSSCVIFSALPLIISMLLLFGGMSGGGALFERLDCKTEADWVESAKKYTFLPRNIWLSRKIELENKKPVEIFLDSKEIRCIDTLTGELSIISLDEECKRYFLIDDVDSLKENEVILDLSGAHPQLYIGKGDVPLRNHL